MRYVEPTSEHEHQARFFAFVRERQRFDDRYRLVYAVPNGGWLQGDAAMRQRLGRKLKREGLEPGVPDVNVDWPSMPYVGMRIEFKNGSAGVVTQSQRAFHRLLERAGYYVFVARSYLSAIEELETYLNGNGSKNG